MNLGQFEELDAAMASKKRGRELAQAEQEMREAQEIEDKVMLFNPLQWNKKALSLIENNRLWIAPYRKIKQTEEIICVVDAICRRRDTFAPSNPDTSAGIRVMTLDQVRIEFTTSLKDLVVSL